jgi:muconolactone delta-isomerase
MWATIQVLYSAGMPAMVPPSPTLEPSTSHAVAGYVLRSVVRPTGTVATVDEVRVCEAAHSRQLAAQGHLLRLWRPPLQPGEWRTLGRFAADDTEQLEKVLASMPLHIWRTDEVTPLAPHPNDPAPIKS